MKKVFDEKGNSIFLGSVIGYGAEAEVYTIHGSSNTLAKIYKESCVGDTDREEKLKYMIAHYPSGSLQDPIKTLVRGVTRNTVTVAWPIHVLYDEHKRLVGYIMPKIDYSLKFTRFSSPKIRDNSYGKLTQKQVATVAKNLAITFDSLHKMGCIVCDSNEENYLIDNNGFVVLIDTDSFQIKSNNGHVFKSAYFTPENSPAEYQTDGKIIFTQEGDCFILAVFIFKLLMNGYHPFRGHPLPSSRIDSTQDIEIKCITNGWFPYEHNRFIEPPKSAPEYIDFSPIRSGFHDCFIQGYKTPSKRPTASDWIDILQKFSFSQEATVVKHVTKYANTLKMCPFLLVMDVTPSLTRYYDSLQNGFNLMIKQLKELDSNSRTEFHLIEFADPPESVIPFTPISDVKPHSIRLRGDYTNIGEAFIMGLDNLEKKMSDYTLNDVSFYKPIIVLMTDGDPTSFDEREHIPIARQRSRRYDVYTVFVGDLSRKDPADQTRIRTILKSLSTTNSIIELKDDTDFRDFFNWISISVGRR